VENGGISADGLTYTFNIRQGLIFDSGDVLTPQDVEYSIERLMVLDRAGGPSFLFLDILVTGGAFSSIRDDSEDGIIDTAQGKPLAQAIADSVTVSGNAVTFHLVKPFPPFLQILEGGQAGIINQSFAVENGAWPGMTGDVAADTASIAKFNNPTPDDADPLFTVTDGTGPFSLTDWDRTNGEVLMTRNDGFNPPSAQWAELFGRIGPSVLKQVLIRSVPENADRELALQQGTADIATISPRSRVPFVEKLPGVRVVDDIPGLSVASTFFNFNIKGIDDGTAAGVGSGKLDGNGIPSDFFQDNDVREGFVKAFDADTYIKDVFLGKAVQPATPIISALPFFNPNQEAASFDLAASKAAFQRARGGEVWNKGFSFTCFFNEGNESRRIACEVAKQNVEGLNPGKFNIDVQGVPWPVYLQQLDQGIMAYYTLGWLADFIDPSNYINQWMSTGGTFSAPNDIGALPAFSAGGSVDLPSGSTVSYADWDELLNVAFNTVDPADRQALYNEVQAQFVDNNVAVMLSNPIGFNAQRQWVNNYYTNPAVSAPQWWAVDKNVSAKPNCALLAGLGATTSDGSCS